ncbi:hypothetical protein GCM10027291_05020 [Telluribacter humicola]
MPLCAIPTVDFEKLLQQLYSRTFSQISLSHSKQLAAEYFEQLINMPKYDGYEFISLEAMEGSVVK